MQLDPDNLQQPQDPVTIVEWLALKLAEEKKDVNAMTDDEHKLIVLSDLLARLTFFYRGIHILFEAYYEVEPIERMRERLQFNYQDSSMEGESIDFATGGLYDVAMQFDQQTEKLDLSAFQMAWGRKGDREWAWRKSLSDSEDAEEEINEWLQANKHNREKSFTQLLLKIAQEDVKLLDSLFPAMQELSMTFKWKKLPREGAYRDILAEKYPKLVRSVKNLESKVKAQ